MESQLWQVLSPIPNEGFGHAGTEAAMTDWAGKRIALWWNGKPNGDAFLDAFAAELMPHAPGMTVVRVWEERPATMTAYGVSADDLAFMAQRADVVIGALAD